jgi:transcriptional regulator with XRE-family HTH domain
MAQTERDFKKELAGRIVAIRKGAGITQQQLANAMGCHSTRVSHLESGRADIRVSTLLDVARALNVSPRELLPKVAA